MKGLLVLLAHLLTTVAKLMGPGSTRTVVADSLLLKQQLLVVSGSRRRAPNLPTLDRILLGFWSLFLSPGRIERAALVLQPATLLTFHEALKKHKYRLLFSSRRQGKSGPEGPSPDLIWAIVELKRRNPRFGCPRLALIAPSTFGVDIDKDVVRRVLARHYRPAPGDVGPSWLTFLGHMKDSLWNIDLFRRESILLKSHWVLVVMYQFTRRLISFGVHTGDVDGVALCRLFNKAISRKGVSRYLSSDHDPLLEYHRWKANLRILDIEEVKTVPHAPLSHPFVERLSGTIRRELLDPTLYWNAADFQSYFNEYRVHSALGGHTPAEASGERANTRANLHRFGWQTHCCGLYQLPVAT